MVAAANSILTTGPAAGNAGANATADAKNNAGDASDEFTQLLNSLLGNNQSDDASAVTTTNGIGEIQGKSKDDDAADTDTDTQDVRQWLLIPAATIPPTPTTTPTADDINDGIDALTPAGNGSTNALLAQSLRRLGTEKNALPTSEKQGENSTFPLSTEPSQSQSLLDSMLKQPQDNFRDSLSLMTADKNNNSAGNDGSSKLPDGMQALANVQANSANAVADSPTTQYQIHSRVGSQEWTRDVGDRLSMMVSNKVHSASLQLTPDNLGPVQVKIDVNNNQASVWFTADHPDTRTALEQSLPRLREMFASQGMSLMDAGVFNQQSQSQPQFRADPAYATSSGITDMSNEATMTQQTLKIGLLDTYA